MLESGQGLARRMIDVEMGRLTFGWTVGVCLYDGIIGHKLLVMWDYGGERYVCCK